MVHGVCGEETGADQNGGGVDPQIGWDPNSVPEPWTPPTTEPEDGTMAETEPWVNPKTLDPNSKDFACKVHGDCGKAAWPKCRLGPWWRHGSLPWPPGAG